MSLDIATIKLTFDTDENRKNARVAGVRLPSGRLVAFYDKELSSGIDAYVTVTFTGFVVSAGAGSGVINGIPVSWSASDITFPAGDVTYLLYVTPAGIVGATADYTMSFTKDVIWLAWVFVGASSINRVETIENIGRYVFARPQVQVGGEWVWSDFEFLLNSGKSPSAFYNMSDSLIYMSYIKDDASYIRTFSSLDELTWSYISNIKVVASTLSLPRDPENRVLLFTGSSGMCDSDIIDVDFLPMGDTGAGYIIDNYSQGTFDQYIFLPTIGITYAKFIRMPITYEIGSVDSAGVFLLEDSVTRDSLSTTGFYRWHKWEGSPGVKYVRVKAYVTRIRDYFTTPPSNYKQVEVFSDLNKTSTTFRSISSEVLGEIYTISTGSSPEASAEIVESFDRLRVNPADTFELMTDPGHMAASDVVDTFDRIRSYKEDSVLSQSGCGVFSSIDIQIG